MKGPRTLLAGVVAGACLLSQTFLLPYFVYPFLGLSIAWLVARRWARAIPTPPAPLRSERIRLVVLGALLILVLAGTTRIESLVFFLSSLSCAFLVIAIDRIDPFIKVRAAVGFVVFCTLLVPIGLLWLGASGLDQGIFQFSTEQMQFRFRGLNLEPNHLGFALAAAYIVVLFDPQSAFQRRVLARRLTIGAIWFLSILTFSPFALATLVVISVPYLWRFGWGRVACLGLLAVVLIVANESERAQQILAGEDSSANFRTWGSLVIGYLQLENCGQLGCGLGASRGVLADEPLMEVFAAQETLVLPNLLASAMVEGGYALLALALLAIAFAAFPPLARGRWQPSGVSIATFLLLLSFAASGSYPFDAQFWSTLGLLAATVRSTSARAARTRAPRKSTPRPAPLQ